MRYKYYFCEKYSTKLVEFLKKHGIKYIPNDGNLDGELIYFTLFSNSIDTNYLIDELCAMKVSRPIVSVEFTNTELNNAKLLVMIPKRQSIDILNIEEAYNYSCKWISSMGLEKANHEEQVDTFVIKKEPSLKSSTAFWTEDTGFAEIFTDRRVFELVKEQSLKGVNFQQVMNKHGVYSENIYQIKSPNIISRDCIRMGYGERKSVCHICGKEQFCIDNTYQLHLDFSKIDIQSDLYMTERMWGEGIAYPLYIISQNFYQLLKQNKLAGGITLLPVVEIVESEKF